MASETVFSTDRSERILQVLGGAFAGALTLAIVGTGVVGAYLGWSHGGLLYATAGFFGGLFAGVGAMVAAVFAAIAVAYVVPPVIVIGLVVFFVMLLTRSGWFAP